MANDFDVLIQRIRDSDRILAIVGAGLSRPSGLPTFRQDPDTWGRPISEIATKSAFLQSPASVWQVYERMRRIAIWARPNAGHEALAPWCCLVWREIALQSVGAHKCLAGFQ